MSTALVLAVLLAAPALTTLAALAATATGRRADAVAAVGAVATALVAVGAGVLRLLGGDAPTAAIGATTVLRLDGAAVLLVLVAATVASTVLLYARNHLDGSPGRDRFAVAASGLLGATVGLAVGASIVVVAVAWIGSSVATVALCAHRGDATGTRTARRARAALVPSDAALLAATVVVVATAGPVGVEGLSGSLADGSVLGVSAGPLVAALLVVAALGRAGQAPFGPWMVGTVDTPTPVSALLHAGSVNAGGFLLVRSSGLLWAAPVVRIGLAAAAVATVVLAAAEARSRADAKGRLATSTAAQMGVMLLAAAVGAPGAVLTHLAGHSLYKSSRFLGAGGAVAAAVERRRGALGPAAPAPRRVAAVALAAALTAGLGVAAGTALGLAPGELGASTALLVTVVGTGAWVASATSGARARSAMATALAGAGLLAIGAVLVDITFALAHPEGGALLGLVAFVGLLVPIGAATALAPNPAVASAAARWADPAPSLTVRSRRAPSSPSIPAVPALQRSW